MGSSASSRWSTLIIRVWLTEGEGAGVRARLTELDDVESPGRTVAVAEGIDDVLEATRDWLVRVVAGGGG
jgi:hypothetical protein